jgi:hypothetical protein
MDHRTGHFSNQPGQDYQWNQEFVQVLRDGAGLNGKSI